MKNLTLVQFVPFIKEYDAVPQEPYAQQNLYYMVILNG